MNEPLSPASHALPHPAVAPGLVVIHEDPHLLVLDKPSGLLCVPGRGDDKQDCLSARAFARWPDALVVHRLDMATSGLVLMARSPGAQRLLGDAFAARDVRKGYEAIVAGTPAASPGWSTIDAPIAADWPRRPMQRIDPSGKPSVTRWRVLERRSNTATDGATRLALEPLTGRTHQLRVHLASIGHAILGDPLYADAAAQSSATRLMLHATHLELPHPATGKTVSFESAPPF